MRTQRQSPAFEGIVTQNERSHLRAPVLGARKNAPNSITTPPNPTGFGLHSLPPGIGSQPLFQPTAQETLPLLFFGIHPSNAPAQSLCVSQYCKGDGKVTVGASGSSSFKVKMIRTSEWIDTPGGGTEKQVEIAGGSFNGKQGLYYTVFLEYDPAKGTGIQTGKLSIQEPKRTMVAQLQGESFAKELVVQIDKIAPAKPTVIPGETFSATVYLDVQQNAPSQIYLAPVHPGQLTMAKQSAWAVKPGKSNQKIQITVPAATLDTPGTTLAIGVYDASNGKLLSTKNLSVAVQREWAEWNYKQATGKQTVWGRLQLASSGEYIWSVEAHNASWKYPDRFYHGVCLPGQGKLGIGPGSHMQMKLPGRTDRFYWVAVGKMELASWSSARKAPLSIFLGVWNGNPWFSNEIDLIEGVIDLTGMAQAGSSGIESEASQGQLQWMKNTQFQPTPISSLKGWFK